MNKVLDSEDEYNVIKRRSRTKAQLAIVRPWQNKIMAKFLLKLFEEAGEDTVLQRSTVNNKYNEAGVPLTWARLVGENVMFEKKTNFPPWAVSQKITVVLPLKSTEENLKELEQSIVNIIKEKV